MSKVFEEKAEGGYMSLEERFSMDEIEGMLSDLEDVMRDLNRSEKFELIGFLSDII